MPLSLDQQAGDGQRALICPNRSSHDKVTNSPKPSEAYDPIFISLRDPPQTRSGHGRETGGGLRNGAVFYRLSPRGRVLLTHSQWPEEAHAGMEVRWRVKRLDGPSRGWWGWRKSQGRGAEWADLKEASQSWDPRPWPQEPQPRPLRETLGSEVDGDLIRPRPQRR